MGMWSKIGGLLKRGRDEAPVANPRSSRVSKTAVRQPVPRAMRGKLEFVWARIPHRGTTLLILAGLGVSGFVFHRFLFDSDYFAVKQWDVKGLHRLSAKDVRFMAGFRQDEDTHLLTYDAAGAEKVLLENPAVRAARVEKIPPERVLITVSERVEEAVLVSDTGSFLVDCEGHLFARATSKELLDPGLAILTGQRGKAYEVGNTLPVDFREAAFLYLETARGVDTGIARDIAEINWTVDTGVTLYLKNGARLVCGHRKPFETFPKAEALERKIGGWDDVDYADLRIDSHVAWMPVAQPEPPKKKSRQIAKH